MILQVPKQLLHLLRAVHVAFSKEDQGLLSEGRVQPAFVLCGGLVRMFHALLEDPG